jgi:hypothetical protein
LIWYDRLEPKAFHILAGIVGGTLVEVLIALGIIIAIALGVAKAFKPSKFKSRRAVKALPVDSVKIMGRQENEKGLLIDLDVEGFSVVHCQIYRDGSPAVDVFEGEDKYRYYVNNHKWKDANTPFEARKIAEIIREEWTKAWEQFGKPEFISDRKAPAPPPEHVDYSIREIEFKYDSANLSSLPSLYPVTGSTGSQYKLNLQILECTCPDFEKVRKDFLYTDIRRICKHQARAIIDLGKNTKITDNKMMHSFIRHAAGVSKGVFLYDKFWEVTINEPIRGQNPFFILTQKGDNPWAQIFFFTDKDRDFHGYNVKENRWGYHRNPFPSGSRLKYNFVLQKVLGIE